MPADQFLRTTLERHNPVTVRHRAGEDYRGCLTVRVRQSRELYQRLDGIVRALVAGIDTQQAGSGRVP